MRAIVAALFASICAACGSLVDPLSSSTSWPNEPAAFRPLTDQAWTVLSTSNWKRRDSSADRIVKDTTAPDSPGSALEYVYQAGFIGGTAPATHYFPLNHQREIFVGLSWKVSSPWQGHSSEVNKIQFVYTTASDIAMVMFGPPGGPYSLRVMPQWAEHDRSWLTPNVGNPPVMLGTWHRLEWYLKYETSPGQGDGIVRWWLDGVLVGDYPNLHYPNDAGFVEYQMSPTWGGVGDFKTETDYYWFNRTYISAATAGDPIVARSQR